MSADVDVTKFHFLGSVDYAAHNFARLKPLLYSETGHTWDGAAKREWFPTQGLIFSLATDLRYAPGDSLWLFRATSNTRTDGHDRFATVQVRPATRLRTDLDPMDPEALRRFATQHGFTNTHGAKTVGLPEEGDRWVIAPDLVKGDDGLWRLPEGPALKHMKVFEGEPEALCGVPTQDGQFVLPPIPGTTSETRNWMAPGAFIEDFAHDLRRWVGHGAQKTQAAAAATILRDLTPHLEGLSALRGTDARAALARARRLIEDAEAITSATDDIVEAISATEPFQAAIAAERERIRVTLEDEALAGVEALETQARSRMIAERERLDLEIEVSRRNSEALRAEISGLEAEAEQARRSRGENVGALEREIDELLARAASEPARVLADWLGVSGFVVTNAPWSGEAEPAQQSSECSVAARAPILELAGLGRALFEATPERGDSRTRLLELDAAIRARELPVLIGRHSRDFAEAWLGLAAGGDPMIVVADPTILSLRDLTQGRVAGESAPLTAAFDRAMADQSRAVVVLLDDPDPAAASFWLPEFARALRAPSRYGFPPNLVALVVIEADPSQFRFTAGRAGELFPMVFLDSADVGAPGPARGAELDLSGVAAPRVSTLWSERIDALRTSASMTLTEEEAGALAKGFGDFLGHVRDGPPPEETHPLAGRLWTAAKTLMIENLDRENA